MLAFNELIIDTETHVRYLFRQHHQANLAFHNLEHTQSVVKHVQEIASHYKVPEKEMSELTIAAWIHDTGHLLTEPPFHEEKSVALMEEFIKSKTGDEELINNVAR